MAWDVGLLHMSLMLRCIFFLYLVYWEFSIPKRCWIFLNAFSASIEMITYFVHSLKCSSLYTHLYSLTYGCIPQIDHFNMLLDSACILFGVSKAPSCYILELLIYTILFGPSIGIHSYCEFLCAEHSISQESSPVPFLKCSLESWWGEGFDADALSTAGHS